jgi:CHAT domain-containing protein
VRAGEEVLGMTAAWQHAGARTVVASPVRVNDDAACEVFCAHHERLARGERPAAALAAATANLPAGSAPAPLICFGAGW